MRSSCITEEFMYVYNGWFSVSCAKVFPEMTQRTSILLNCIKENLDQLEAVERAYLFSNVSLQWCYLVYKFGQSHIDETRGIGWTLMHVLRGLAR